MSLSIINDHKAMFSKLFQIIEFDFDFGFTIEILQLLIFFFIEFLQIFICKMKINNEIESMYKKTNFI